MSSDTTKENASVVDSSLTEWKHDVENLNDLESPGYKEDDNAYCRGLEERVHSSGEMGNSSAIRNGKLDGTRYFIIKSLNHENIQLSIKRGIWATQDMNEPILEEAFHNSGKVILIFSVNMSGFFQGYAQMMSSIGWRRDNVWSQGNGGRNPWGRSFKVKWLRLYDLPFQKTLHLKNPLNNYKPVKISRDCQELPKDIGEALCGLLDGKIVMDPNLERDDQPSKRPCVVPLCALQDEVYNMPSVHRSWTGNPMLSPSLFYQHQIETTRFHLPHQRSSEVERDNFSRFDVWGLSVERSPHASTLTEDDLLEMSYEEYLEVHSRSNKQTYPPAAGPSWRTRESAGAEHGDGLYSHCHTNKRTHHPYHK